MLEEIKEEISEEIKEEITEKSEPKTVDNSIKEYDLGWTEEEIIKEYGLGLSEPKVIDDSINEFGAIVKNIPSEIDTPLHDNPIVISEETEGEIVKTEIRTRGKGKKTKKREKAQARKDKKLALIKEEEDKTIDLQKFQTHLKQDLLEEVVLKPEILSPVEKIAFNTAKRNVFSTKGGDTLVKSGDAKRENNKTVFKINKKRPFNNIGRSIFNKNK